jgi:hypothetical protein
MSLNAYPSSLAASASNRRQMASVWAIQLNSPFFCLSIAILIPQNRLFLQIALELRFCSLLGTAIVLANFHLCLQTMTTRTPFWLEDNR